ncbi:hypothetical protein TRFO_06698 [Tritrichomonas foetus]|uniref:Uncharacterized protein n=1 Tax=Tritrichomonas foetus TaxID=1144522 RepID=A0A1J4JWS0_9EUKA|nr:hypothetical protein TRFO_06698 [Tritrichomonas foetus]|eukprot:OHT03451.1 hypothetical protein TRFO_06698 [Tritrichomonas foetus]
MSEQHQSGNQLKNKLQETAIKTILLNAPPEGLNSKNIQLFKLLIRDKSSISAVMSFFTTPHPISLVSSILNILYDFFSTSFNPSENYSDSELNDIFLILLECVNKQVPSSNNKIDIHILTFIDSISKLAFLFSTNISQYLSNLPANLHQVAFLLTILSFFDDVSQFNQQIQPIILTKPSLTTLTFAILKLLAKHEKIENAPAVKTVISFYKSLPENEISSYAIPTVLKVIDQRLQSNALKEIPPFISYLIRRVKKDVEHLPNVCDFIDKVLEFPDSIPLIKPLNEDIILLFISNAQATDIEINDNVRDPLTCGNSVIVKSFLNYINKLSLPPLETLTQMRDTSIGMLILAYAITDSSENEFQTQEIDTFLAPLINQNKLIMSPAYQFLIRICGVCANRFSSKLSLKILVSALATGSKVAYEYLINDTISFEFIFPEIVNGFKPGRIDTLYIQALQSLLQVNLPTLPDQPPPLDTDSTFSDSNFDCISEFAQLKSIESDDEMIPGAPTTTTTLFCNVISSVSDFPELMPLLGPSAASLNNQFSVEFLSNIQISKHKGSKLEILAAYSNSIEILDLELIHSLALTFLMILPGQSMLFLAISLQRLPRHIILSALQKAVPYANTSPDLFGRMVALIAHSHPDIAISYIDAFITNSVTRKRVFFIFKTSETSENTLVVVFKTIGYCSAFIDSSFFISDFLPFATSFMNKHLTTQPKNSDVAHAALFAIRKMCFHIYQWQEVQMDQVFPFKDFLVTYVTNHLKEQVERNNSGISYDETQHSSILSTLASLVRLRPIRAGDRYESALEYTAELVRNSSEKVFSSVLKAAQQLYLVLMESNPSIFVFINISLPMFPNFLHHKEWSRICEVMHDICNYCKTIKINQGNSDLTKLISNINTLIVNTLPLICSEQYGRLASNIIHDLIVLQCSIRNQIVSMPKAHSPKPIEFRENMTGNDLCKIVCHYLSKNLMTSQTFEIITELLEKFTDPLLLPIHHEGIALTIKYLLEIKGIEEFRFDTKIITGLIEMSDDKNEDVISVFMDIIDLISQMRLYSVLSVLVSQTKLEFQDGMFEKIINRIIRNKKSAEALASYLADNMISDDVSERFLWFARKTIPMLGNVINDADNEIWAQLFIGIIRQNESIESPMFRALFNDHEFHNLSDYAKKAADEHPLALQLILSGFPEKPTEYTKQFSLAFAACSLEMSHSFLNYALKNLTADDLDDLSQIFEKIDSEVWDDLSESFILLLINCIMGNSKSCPIKYVVSFLTNASIDSVKLFWDSFAMKAMEDLPKFSQVLLDISQFVEIDIESLVPIIPSLIVFSSNDEIIFKLIQKLNQQLEQSSHPTKGKNYQLKENSTSIKNPNENESDQLQHEFHAEIENNEYLNDKEIEWKHVTMKLLGNKVFESSKDEFLNRFMEMMNRNQFTSQCISSVSTLIEKADKSNSNFIEMLINQMPNVEEKDQMQIAALVQTVIN